MNNAIKSFATRFKDDERGVISIELLLMVPILVWALLSTAVYFDAFHKMTMSTRAALTVVDLYTREQDSIDDDYIDGTQSLLRTLSLPDGDPDMRVTVYTFNDVTNAYELVWSKTRGTEFSPHTTASLGVITSQLPILANDARSILVETRTSYSPPFSIGIGPFLSTNLDDKQFDTFMVASPRFVPTLCFDEPPYGSSHGDKC